MSTSVVFLGSPAAALPSLRVLAAHEGCRVVGVFVQPDKPKGRGRRSQPGLVRAEAEALGLPVFSPPSLNAPAGLAELRGLAPSLVIVCAYGQIFSQAVLEGPALGCFNLHFSLLPRWRGASPLQAAILAGDTHTGVTLQRMVKKLDAGGIAAQSPPLAIGPDEVAGQLELRLAETAAQLLERTLPALLRNEQPLRPQDELGVTTCALIPKAAGAVDWSAESAQQILRKLRAFTPWPGCFGYLGARRVVLTRLESVEAPPEEASLPPGTLTSTGVLRTRRGWLQLKELKPEGKGNMSYRDFINGAPHALGQRLTLTPPTL